MHVLDPTNEEGEALMEALWRHCCCPVDATAPCPVCRIPEDRATVLHLVFWRRHATELRRAEGLVSA